MEYGREYARRPSGGAGWVVLLLVGLALLLRFGGSQPIVELREKTAEVWAQWDYSGTLETLGRDISGEGQDLTDFSRKIFGFEREPAQ